MNPLAQWDSPRRFKNHVSNGGNEVYGALGAVLGPNIVVSRVLANGAPESTGLPGETVYLKIETTGLVTQAQMTAAINASIEYGVVKKVYAVIDFSDLTGLAPGVTSFDVPFSAAVPADARLLGVTPLDFLPFVNAGTLLVKAGIFAGNAAYSSGFVDILSPTTGRFALTETPGWLMTAGIPVLTISGAADLNTVVSGHLRLELCYARLL